MQKYLKINCEGLVVREMNTGPKFLDLSFQILQTCQMKHDTHISLEI